MLKLKLPQIIYDDSGLYVLHPIKRRSSYLNPLNKNIPSKSANFWRPWKFREITPKAWKLGDRCRIYTDPIGCGTHQSRSLDDLKEDLE